MLLKSGIQIWGWYEDSSRYLFLLIITHQSLDTDLVMPTPQLREREQHAPPWLSGTSQWEFSCVIRSVSRPGAETTPEHILFPDNRPGLPCYTHTAGVHHCEEGRKLLHLTHCLLIYTVAGSSPQPAGVHKLNKFNTENHSNQSGKYFFFTPRLSAVNLTNEGNIHIDTHEINVVGLFF